MLARPGFARLRPLIAMTALAAGTVALLVCERPKPRPPTPISGAFTVSLLDTDCSDVSPPAPSSGIMDRYGRRWALADIPGGMLQGLDLRDAEWAGVDLHRATFLRCDFSECDLRGADLRETTLAGCDFTGADLTDADLTGAAFDSHTRWPIGFDPQARGARLES
jgi:uncharacterized protein YjbI with pentapeptide repeats